VHPQVAAGSDSGRTENKKAHRQRRCRKVSMSTMGRCPT
jgi:hypothetical protein